MKSGLIGQVGFKPEAVVNTPETVTMFIPWRSVTLAKKEERIEDAGIIAGRRLITSNGWHEGRTTIDGAIQMSLYNLGQEALFTLMFGTKVDAGAGPYTHTYTIGDRDGDTATIQVGKPGTGGTVHAETFSGCKVPSWEIAIAEGEVSTLGIDVVGMGFSSATGLATNSIASGTRAFKGAHSTLSLGGSAVKMKKMVMKGNGGLDVERRFCGQDTIEEPFENDLVQITFDLDLEFGSTTQRDLYYAGTEHALVCTTTDGTSTFVVTANVRYDGPAVEMDGPGLLMQSVPTKLVASSTDAAAFTAVLTNTNAT